MQAIREEGLRTLPRQECFERGYITVKDLDDEELRYGRCRDESGRIPKVNGKTELIPRELYDEMVAEHELRYKQKLRQNLDSMVDIMVGIAQDDTVEPRERFEAAKYIFERTAGKTPDNVTVNIKTAPWEDLLSQVSGIASVTRREHRELNQAGHNAGILDAEVVDAEDDVPSVTFIGDDDQDAEQYDDDDQDGEDVLYGADTRAKPDLAAERMVPDIGEPVVRQDVNAGPAHEMPAQANEDTDRPLKETTLYGEVAIPPDYIHRADNEKPPVPNFEGIDVYGHRKAQAKSYAEQARDAKDLAERRKEAREKRRNAIKQRKINRAMGADAIKTEITGVELGEDGQIKFNTE